MSTSPKATPTPHSNTAAHPSKSIIESSYDHIAPTYLSWISLTSSPRESYVHKLLSLLSPTTTKPKILELGCGAGLPCTKILSEHGAKVTANDISAVQLEMAAKNVPSATFIHSDMMSLNFPPSAFDAVVAFYSIIHLPREEQVVLMKRIHSWTKPYGYFLANFGTRDDPESEKENWLGGRMWWSGFDVEGNLGMIEGAGWTVMEKEVLEQEERMEESDESRMVPFLWVVGRKGPEEEGKVDG
jgi:SAM-dependent methyltransferase